MSTPHSEYLKEFLIEVGRPHGLVAFNGSLLEWEEAMAEDRVLPFILADAQALIARSGLGRHPGLLPEKLATFTQNRQGFFVAETQKMAREQMVLLIHFAAESVLALVRASVVLGLDGIVEMSPLLRRHRFAIQLEIEKRAASLKSPEGGHGAKP